MSLKCKKFNIKKKHQNANMPKMQLCIKYIKVPYIRESYMSGIIGTVCISYKILEVILITASGQMF